VVVLPSVSSESVQLDDHLGDARLGDARRVRDAAHADAL